MATKKEPNNGERPVVVCTEFRGVFFGYAKDTSGDSVKLRAGRMCVYWTAEMRGAPGLAKMGPDKGCRISPPADVELRKITAVFEVDADAVKRWEDAPWGR